MKLPLLFAACPRSRHRAEEARDFATVLALKPSQQRARDAWLAVMALPALKPHEDGATAPERQQHAEAGIAATKRLYASLDGRRQQVFDTLARPRHEGHHGWHGGHGRGDRGTVRRRGLTLRASQTAG